MNHPKILTLAGSTRAGSYNGKLAAVMAHALAVDDAQVTQISLLDYDMPLYNSDLEAQQGLPENAVKLSRQIASHHGIFLAAPEYNAGVTPLLKNTLDWVSRSRDNGGETAFSGPVFLIGAASPGSMGGTRGLIQLRQILSIGLGALVLPQQAMVPNAAKTFDTDGRIVEEHVRQMLQKAAVALTTAARQNILRSNGT